MDVHGLIASLCSCTVLKICSEKRVLDEGVDLAKNGQLVEC